MSEVRAPPISGWSTRGLVGVLLALTGGLPAAAQATDQCSYEPSTLTVFVSVADQTFASPRQRTIAPENQLIVGPQKQIQFDGVACGSATVSNTDTIIVTMGPYADLFVDLAGGMFAPGASAEADGSPEIEIHVDYSEELAEGPLIIWGRQSRDILIAGSGGIDITGDLDGDLFQSGGDLQLVGFGGRDVLSARGGGALGGSFPRFVVLWGLRGDDRLIGGARTEYLYGGRGDDRLAARGGGDRAWGQQGDDAIKGQTGDDSLDGGSGDDVVLGGAGTDYCRQGGGTGPVRCEHDLSLED